MKNAAPKAIAAAEKAVGAVDAEIGKLQPGQFTPSPEAVAKIAALQKTFDATNAQIEPLRAARAKFKDGTPDYAKASAAVQAKKDERPRSGQQTMMRRARRRVSLARNR